jgi:ribosome maturation factor RimP
MRYTPMAADGLYDTIEPVVKGLGLDLIELTVSRHKGSVQVRAVVYKDGSVGTDDCSRVHRAIIPRMELSFPGQDIYLEVSSPGIERLLKDGAEFAHFIGKPVRCYRTDISDWTSGVLVSADERQIVIKGMNEMVNLSYGVIAKAKLVSGAPAREEEAGI